MEEEKETVAETTNGRSFSLDQLAIIPVILILLLGGYLRFTGLDWDKSFHLHPDERFLTDTSSLLQPTLDPVLYLKTSESPMNPYNVGKNLYVYGNFPMTFTRLASEWVVMVCDNLSEPCDYQYNSYNGIHIVGRALAGLVDLIAVFFIFLIGRRLYDWRVGLIVSFLLATAVMPIQQSHFYTMDTWSSTFTTITIYMAVRAAGFGDPENKWQLRWYVLFGLFLGLSVASRVNVAPLAVIIGLSAIIWLIRRGYTWQSLMQTQIGGIDLQRVFLGGIIAALVSIMVFRVAQPYAFADSNIVRQTAIAETGEEPSSFSVAIRSVVGFNPQWLSNLEEIQRLQAPEASFPPALQWTDRDALIFPLVNMIMYGMGIMAGITAWLGFFWAIGRMARLKPEWTAHLIPVAWSAIYFLFMGTRWVKSIRYFLPIYPTLLLLGAWALFALWQKASQDEGNGRVLRQALAGVAIAAILIPTFVWANTFVDIYRNPVTRVAASAWIYENVPTGATLLYLDEEGQEQELHLPLKGYEFQSTGLPLNLNFQLEEAGVATAVRFNYLSDPNYQLGQQPSTFSLQVNLDDNEPTIGQFSLTDEREAQVIQLPRQRLEPDTLYRIGAQHGGEGGNIRAGTSLLMNEHWDDLLPISMDGRAAYASYYTEVSGGQRPVTHPDDPAKRQVVIEWLDEADYIMISSQRAMWSLPRLPLTYPLMMQYYEGLFNGELGFELVHQEHATHQVGPLYFSDTSGQFSWGTPPEIGWPPPSELAAEEAFSVYDHPPVWIFAKRDDFDRDQMVQTLGAVDLSNTIVMNPGEATNAPNGLMLPEDEFAEQQAGGTFNELFNPDSILSQNPTVAAVVWWLAVILLGWLAFPILFVMFRGLPQKGYALARIFSLLFISYFAWLMASLEILPHTRGTLFLGLVLMVGLSGVLFARHRVAIVAHVRENLSYINTIEVLSLFLYILFIGIRMGNPDVWDIIYGGEKPMNMSYFSAVLKSTSFPPYDPWYAGGYINYYYYGYVVVGSLTKLLGIVPALAYNLILPMLYSFTGVGAFAIAYNLISYREQNAQTTGKQPAPDMVTNQPTDKKSLHQRALAGGMVAMVLCVMLGNLAQLQVITNAWYSTGDPALEEIPAVGVILRTLDGGLELASPDRSAPMPTGDWFWVASRAINWNDGEAQPITEFPFFTFLYGDLHAHMISLPLQLLALGWAVGLALQATRKRREDEVSGAWWETAVQFIIGGIIVGSLRATNTWDWPTYMVIGTLAVLFYVWQSERANNPDGSLFTPTLVTRMLLLPVAFLTLSVLTFWPFAANYGTGYSSARLWDGSYTYLTRYLVVYGLFLFFLVPYLFREIRAWAQSWTEEGMQRMEPFGGVILISLLIYVGALLVLFYRNYWIAPVVLTLIVISGLLGLRANLPPMRRVVLILLSSALGLTLLVEIVVLEGDIGRMNTVFKFYMQVWLILSVLAGVTAVWLYPTIQQKSRTTRVAWQAVLGVLLFIAALYPFTATLAKWEIRMSEEAPATLDGMAFMKTTSYNDLGQSVTLNYDYEAIQWMYRNIEGSPVIVEGHSHDQGGFSPYRSITNRVAMYTGLPAVVGWDWHQRQQRAVLPGNLVSDRIREVNRFYNTINIPEALTFLEKYDVGYVYVGQLEWTYYSPDGLNKFDQMVEQGLLEEVYRNPGTSIYRVIASGDDLSEAPSIQEVASVLTQIPRINTNLFGDAPFTSAPSVGFYKDISNPLPSDPSAHFSLPQLGEGGAEQRSVTGGGYVQNGSFSKIVQDSTVKLFLGGQ